MKTRLFQFLLVLLFCVSLGAVPVLFALLPKEDFSPLEKRVLSQAPALSWNNVKDGGFAEQAEEYAADHLPGRTFLVGLNAGYDLLSGRQLTKDVYLGSGGRLFEAPVENDPAVLERNMDAINAFAQAAGRRVDLLLVPSAGYILGEALPPLAGPYPDGDIISAVGGMACSQIRSLDVTELFAGFSDPASLYYRTDHHWTSRGAYLAAGALLESCGRSAVPESAYEKTAVPGFRGSTYSRAALWGLPGEDLELWDSGGSFLVSNADGGEPQESLFYTGRLSEADMYPVFLDGNHSLVKIENRAEDARGRLLIVRDSFASCLGCFLADRYREVVLVDLRYYKSPVSQLLDEGFDDVLIVYSVGNFMTDSNIVRLS